MFTVNSFACFVALLVAWLFSRFAARCFLCSECRVVSTSGILGRALCVIRYCSLCACKLERRNCCGMSVMSEQWDVEKREREEKRCSAITFAFKRRIQVRACCESVPPLTPSSENRGTYRPTQTRSRHTFSTQLHGQPWHSQMKSVCIYKEE